jgi:hypothetical protein
MAVPHYTLGIDIGKANDPTALALIEHPLVQKPVYQVRALHRFRLGTPYPTLVERIMGRLSEKPLAGLTRVAIDSTGVGAPVVDLFKSQRRPSDIYAITITSGTSIGGAGYRRTVPKRDLIHTTAVILQQQRLRIATDLPDTAALVDELLSYRIKITDAGHDRYEPASSQDHDDLLLALSLALWLAERNPFRYLTSHVPTGTIPTQHDRYSPYYFSQLQTTTTPGSRRSITVLKAGNQRSRLRAPTTNRPEIVADTANDPSDDEPSRTFSNPRMPDGTYA